MSLRAIWTDKKQQIENCGMYQKKGKCGQISESVSLRLTQYPISDASAKNASVFDVLP